MHVSTIKIFTKAAATFVLLAAGMLANGSADAALIKPTLRLPGIAPQGHPSFTFDVGNQTPSGYQQTIESWYSNLFYMGRSKNGITYDVVASMQGKFRYFDAPGESYRGMMGDMLLTARLGPGGRLLKGELKITGRIKGLGILNPNRTLVTAEVSRISTRGSLVGFAITNIKCAKEIVNCQDDPSIAESVYLRLRQQFPTEALRDNVFVTSIRGNTTTVPIPAAAWLMLSGLGMLGAQAARRKGRDRTNSERSQNEAG